MRPKQKTKARSDDLFRAGLDQIIKIKRVLVVLPGKNGWAWLDGELAVHFCDRGRPAEPVRFIIGMFLLKHTYTLSDKQDWGRRVRNPCFQYLFTGEEFFRHTLPHERSGISFRRQGIGDRFDILLQDTLGVTHDSSAVKKGGLARVTVDTKVKSKNIAFPTDAKLTETAVHQLGKLAKQHGVASTSASPRTRQ